MSSLAVLSFIAGILSILAPCILPVLPVILGGSLGTNNLHKPLVIITSTAVSIILFTIILKVSTAFIAISPSVWSSISAIIIIMYGLTLIAPHQREQVSILLGLYKVNNLTSMAQKHDGVLGNILLGASLGPIFTSCSPTYTLLLSTIFPNSFTQGVIYTLIYSLGFALALFAVAYGGRAVTQHLSHLANPTSRFKKTLGIILVVTGILIITGYMKQIESAFIDRGRVGVATIEQTLLDTTTIKQNSKSVITEDVITNSTSGGIQDRGRYLDYNTTNISSLTGDIVLFFHADRCPTCRQAEKSFLETGIPVGLTIIKVDYDTNHKLRKKYTVLSQTSYVYIKPDGTLIKRRVGGTNINDITSKLVEIKGNNQSTKPARVASDQVTTAYFAGGCFWCLEGPFESLEGVKQVTNGYIGGSASEARYDVVGQGTTKHREAVQVKYDPALISYGELLETYWRQIDPTDSGGQFADRGYHYTTAIYYSNDQEKQIATTAKNNLETSKKFTKPIVVQIAPATQFYPAEEYHQDYYKKNSNDYQRYKKGSGREDYITTNWKNTKTTTTIIPRQDRPPKSVSDLSDIQRNILFEGGTEPPFDNPYRDNHEAGIYVDVIDGTPLFSSLDKFDSGTGRPSFTKPIDQSMVGSHTDTSLGMTRTEIKSSSSNGHLGHVFDDGPNGKPRYCINSAALEFIPVDQLEIRGYGEYVKLFSK